MKTIVNKTPQPLRVPLPQGKVLHLGPLKTGQIADRAAEHPPLKALVEAGTVDVRDSDHPSAPSTHEHGHGPQESTAGAAPRTVQQAKKGERGA